MQHPTVANSDEGIAVAWNTASDAVPAEKDASSSTTASASMPSQGSVSTINTHGACRSTRGAGRAAVAQPEAATAAWRYARLARMRWASGTAVLKSSTVTQPS